VTIDCPKTRRSSERMRNIERIKMKGRLLPHLDVHSSDHFPIKGTVYRAMNGAAIKKQELLAYNYNN
jgi:hypothetical protein